MPAKHVANLKKTYADIAQGYENTTGQNLDTEILEKFLVYLPEGSHVLDLGAGTGRDSKWFVDHGLDVTMFDMSPDMLNIAKAKVPEAKTIQGDMTEMKFKSEEFDGVWASASILHLTKSEAQQVFKKVYEIVKKGGVFYVLLKAGAGEKEITQDKYGVPATRFFSFYTAEEVEKMLKETGFTNVEATHSSSPGQDWVDAWGFRK